LNEATNPRLLEAFKDAGYLAVPSRQVYIFDGCDTSEAAFIHRHNYHIDKLLLERSNYDIICGEELVDSDFERIAELYQQLYLDKYSRLNPQYSAQWLSNGYHHEWLDFCVLRRKPTAEANAHNRRIDGVVGWFSNEKIITAPIVGYDTKLPQKAGLYRQLTCLCLHRAAQQQKVLNFSSGAAYFKRLRGGGPYIEYSMVYVKHLSPYRRIVWALLSYALHKIAIPIMKKYQL
jgi:hypothetical protein